jgi:hypothetical protein
MRSAHRSDRKSKVAAAKAGRIKAQAAAKAAGKVSRNSKSPPAGGLL